MCKVQADYVHQAIGSDSTISPLVGLLHEFLWSIFLICCRFMKLRLDRVLKGEFEASSDASVALKGEQPKADFKRPEPWTAPYKKYEDKWWEPFLPK